MDLRRALLDVVPDAPTTLEARALLLDPDTVLAGAPAGAVVVHEGHALAAVIGAPPVEVLREALAGLPPGGLLLSARPIPDLGPGWSWEMSVAMVVDGPVGAPAGDPPPRPLVAADLDRVPAPYRPELEGALARGPVMAVELDGELIAFAYAPLRTETWFDISVDTFDPHRGRGHGRRVAAALIAAEVARGRRPVWGAVVSNEASRRVAASLGFRLAGAFWLGVRGEG